MSISEPDPVDDLTAVRFEVDERVATVWLHRPHRHNAWTGRMHAEHRRGHDGRALRERRAPRH